ILLGTFGGAHLAAALSTMFLKAFFALFLLMVCAQMLLDLRPEASRALPGRAGVILVGGVIGLVSALVGIGGGTLSVPFMSYCNVAMRQAIGTSAAIGFPIAAAGTLGYVTSGIGAEGLPSLSLGYVYLPALAGVALGSVLTAPLGASLAHSIPVKTLKRCFGAFLLIVAARMLWDVFTRAS
ncbi:MAG: sulfite exporter TauE/SafE family protein, partial [Polyangia bacterium]|nr:sulfite exporter TauE/SafE family protein [Polyangia bacterium]